MHVRVPSPTQQIVRHTHQSVQMRGEPGTCALPSSSHPTAIANASLVPSPCPSVALCLSGCVAVVAVLSCGPLLIAAGPAAPLIHMSTATAITTAGPHPHPQSPEAQASHPPTTATRP